MSAYQYRGANTLEQQLAETERQLAEARKTIRELRNPKMPTPHSEGHARLLAATREAFAPRKKASTHG